MVYLKKEQILQMEGYQLLNEFERTVIGITKMENFTKRGTTPKAARQLDWLREEIFSRMNKERYNEPNRSTETSQREIPKENNTNSR